MKIASFVVGAASIANLLFATSASAYGLPTCAFGIFRPLALAQEISVRLATSNVAVVKQGVETGGTTDRALLVREGGIVGRLVLTENPRTAEAELTVVDADDKILLAFKEQRAVCLSGTMEPGGGLCSSIRGYTELEPVIGGINAFEITFPPDDTLPDYFRYGAEISHYDFRSVVSDSINWLTATLGTTTLAIKPPMLTAPDRLYWAMASDPEVAPYIPQLKIVEDGGRLALTGVVPSNYVFNQIVDAAHAAGLWNINPWMIVDTGMDALPILGPTLSSCH